MTNGRMTNGSLQRYYDRFLKITMAAVLSIGLVIFPMASDAIAYSVDYEMDKARAEKTVEHYGEPIRPIVEQAIENNENNPDSKATAENSYQRESPPNRLLPKRWGKFFSKKDFLDMSDTEDPNAG